MTPMGWRYVDDEWINFSKLTSIVIVPYDNCYHNVGWIIQGNFRKDHEHRFQLFNRVFKTQENAKAFLEVFMIEGDLGVNPHIYTPTI